METKFESLVADCLADKQRYDLVYEQRTESQPPLQFRRSRADFSFPGGTHELAPNTGERQILLELDEFVARIVCEKEQEVAIIRGPQEHGSRNYGTVVLIA